MEKRIMNLLQSFFTRIRIKIKNLHFLARGVNCDLLSTFNKSDESILVLNNATIIKSHFFIRQKSQVVFGNNCVIKNSVIHLEKGSLISFGNNCKIIDASITLSGNSEVYFGNDTEVRSEKPFYESKINIFTGKATFGENANIKGIILVHNGNLSFGRNSFLNHGSEIRSENEIKIGESVFISYFVDIYDNNTHSLDWKVRQKEIIDGYPNTTKQTISPPSSPVSIGDHVWIGKYAAIMKGCSIGEKCVIGTRAVVTKSFEKCSLIAGNPARVVRRLSLE